MSSDVMIRTRTDGAQEARDRRFRAAFENRSYRVMTEITTRRDEPAHGRAVIYDKGELWVVATGSRELDAGDKFTTPLGDQGFHGFLVQETDFEGTDLPHRAVFGHTALTTAAERFGHITGLPARSRRRPPAASLRVG
jgi:hypothetical protein